MNKMQFHEALEGVWKLVRRTNKYIDETSHGLAKVKLTKVN